MAGGSGTRFWPRSKAEKPKQYLNIVGKESLLQSTINRFLNISNPQNIYVVSGKSQERILKEQTGILPEKNLIYEPVGRNTLPCIGLAAVFVQKVNPDGIMVASPADHLIRNDRLYEKTVLAASVLAAEYKGIVTIGIKPTYPATGYGYVQTDKNIITNNEINQYKVKQFVEKPDEQTANEYLDKGEYYWNSGMFIFKVSVFLEAVKKLAPNIYAGLTKIQSEIGNSSFEETLNSVYPSFENISVDYGIMEHAKNIYLVEGNFGWNDLGSWESVYLTDKKDSDGNALSGECIALDSRNSYVYSDKGLIALIGMDNVIVVQDGNTTLVCNRDNAEDVKKIVNKLKTDNKDHYL
jgi:mannose-1-phosphate guanylyltransferase